MCRGSPWKQVVGPGQAPVLLWNADPMINLAMPCVGDSGGAERAAEGSSACLDCFIHRPLIVQGMPARSAVKTIAGSTAMCAALLLSGGCVSGYQRSYRSAERVTAQDVAATRVAPSPAVPQLEWAEAKDGEAARDARLRRGYALLGSALFVSGNERDEDQAVRQGATLGADLVLVLHPRYLGAETLATPVTVAFRPYPFRPYPYGMGPGPYGGFAYGPWEPYAYPAQVIERWEHAAYFFYRCRYPLGVLAREPSDAERQRFQTNRGAVVRVVVDGTPAFSADILPGDLITALDGVALADPAALDAAIAAHPGAPVTLTLKRNGETLEKHVTLQH